MEATNVEDIGVLGQSPNLGLLQVLDVVVVGGTEVGAQGAVVAGDDGAAATGGLLGVDAVLDAEAGGLDGVVQGGGVLVVADAAEVDDAVGGQDVLCAAGAVLRGTAGNQLGLVVVEEVLVERLVLLIGEDGIVGLELILVEELLVTDSLDVCRKKKWQVSGTFDKGVVLPHFASGRQNTPRAFLRNGVFRLVLDAGAW